MLSWVSADLRTGAILADFPDFVCTRVGSVIGRESTTQGELPLPTAPEGWARAILEWASVLILTDDDQDGTTPRPWWGGVVSRAIPNLGDSVPVSLVTLEAYLDSRFVGDVTYTATGQNEIVADLIDQFVNDGTINIRVEYDGAGQLLDREYKDVSDKSIYSVLTELSGLEGGPEWTIGWEWTHDPERITPVLYVGGADGSPHLGTPVPEGMGPAATFEAPGSVISAQLVRDFGKGKGANRIVASSTANADTRPQSEPQVSDDLTRPTIEHRFSPGTNITEIPTLTSHAQSALAQMQQGAHALSLEAVIDAAPRLNVDWRIGDDIGYSIGGLVGEASQDFVSDGFFDYFQDAFLYEDYVSTVVYHESVPAFPGGFSGTARCIGWEMSLTEPQTIAPILGVD